MRTLLLLGTLLGFTVAAELLVIPTNELELSASAQPGDEIATENPFIVLPKITEEVGVSLDPATKAISVVPNIVGPGQNVTFVIANPYELRKAGKMNFKLMILGLISGDEQTVPLSFVAEEGGELEEPVGSGEPTENDNETTETADNLSGQTSEIPKFEKSRYDLKLESGMTEQQLAVLKLTNSDEEASQYHFDLVGKDAEMFTITHEGNTVYVHSTPCSDCELPDEISLVAIVSNGLKTNSALLVFTKEQNPNGLHFLRKVYETSMVEGSSTFSRLVKLAAKGGNEKRRLFTLQDSSGLFALHPVTGILSIQHPEFLSAEIFGSQLNLTATVSDGVLSETCNISIDIIGKGELGESPKFKQEEYSFVVFPKTRTVGRVELLVPVKDTRYSISEGGGDLFSIDEETGELQYTGTVDKDTFNYTVKVIAESGTGQPLVDMTNVAITVKGLGSFPPNFDSQKADMVTLQKNASVGTPIFTFHASDEDSNSNLLYRVKDVMAVDMIGQMAELPDKNLFAFAEEGRKNGTLVLVGNLSDIDNLSLRVTVFVEDLAHLGEPEDHVTLTVILQSIEKKKDPRPVVAINAVPETVLLPSTLPIGSYVYTVSAQPRIIEEKQQKHMFGLMNQTGTFSIDSKTGVITTSASLRDVKRANLTVLVSNPHTAHTASTLLNVKVLAAHDFAPKFSKRNYTATIMENSPVGSEVTKVTTQPSDSNDSLQYTLEGSSSSAFSIDEQGVVRTVEELDHEETSIAQLFVKAANAKGQFSIAPLAINVADENDSPPTFPKNLYEARVMENLPINSYIVQVKAHDADSKDLEYSIGMGNEATMLHSLIDIDEDGVITNSEQLDGIIGTFPLMILVTDGIHSASANVSLTIEETYKCMPSFAEKSPVIFTIMENGASNFSLGKLQAMPLDEKCGQTFALWDQKKNKYVNETEDIRINSESGELFTMISYDFEKIQRIPIVVALQSGSLFAQQAAELQITDEDDNKIMFDLDNIKFEVSEDYAAGQKIGRVFAYDEDSINDVFYHLLSTENDSFSLDKKTGELSLEKPLDREEKEFYTLDIAASNSFDPMNKTSAHAVATVTIHVKDINDNGPLFDKSTYTILVDKNTMPGEVLLRVYAADPDSVYDENNGVFYRITSSAFDYHGMSRDVDQYFSINSTNGEITLDQPIRDFTGGMFVVKIGSSDKRDGSGHSDKALVKIFVYDVSDIVVMEIPENPVDIAQERLERITKTLANSTGLEPNVRSIKYHHIDGRLIREIADVEMVFVNESRREIIPAERAIAIVDNKGWNDKELAPVLRQISTEKPTSFLSEAALSPILILAGVFTLLLALIFIVFTILLCYYRSRFLREKQIYEDEKILAGALNKENRHLQPPPFLQPPLDNLHEHNSPSQFRPEHYAIQELNLTIDSETDPKKEFKIYEEI